VVGSVDAMLLLYFLEVLLSRSNVFGSRGQLHLLGLMVEDDEVSVHEVKAVQSVAGIFGVHDVLVDDVGGALCCVGRAGSDLPDGTMLAEQVEESGGVDVVGQVLDEEDAISFRSQLVAPRHVWLPSGRGRRPVVRSGRL